MTGPDHIIAMVAVGLWGAQLGSPAIWMLPVTFPLVMAFGGFLGLIGVPLPGVEIGIALSGVLLGAAVMTESRPPLYVAAALVAIFAICHGHAHGAELPPGTSGLTYSHRLRRRDGFPARLRHRDRDHSPMVLRPTRACGLSAASSAPGAFSSSPKPLHDERQARRSSRAQSPLA